MSFFSFEKIFLSLAEKRDKNNCMLHATHNMLLEGISQMKIVGDYIKLDSFLKAVNAVASGGEAKVMIAEGEVQVNGVAELRRGRKLYPGDRVTIGGEEFSVE
jgi:ribosome-associated protein